MDPLGLVMYSKEELDKAWKNRPIYKLTGIPREKFKEIMADPEQLKTFTKVVNVSFQAERALAKKTSGVSE